MIDERPAGRCWTPKTANTFQPVMLKSARSATRSHHARGIATDWPARFAIASSAIAANGSVVARNVSGASSVTPSFKTGQLQPHVRPRTVTSARLDARLTRGVAEDSTLIPAPG